MSRENERSFEPRETSPKELELSDLTDEQMFEMEALDAEENRKNNHPRRIPDWEKFARIVLKDQHIKVSDPKEFDRQFCDRLGQAALDIIEKSVSQKTKK